MNKPSCIDDIVYLIREVGSPILARGAGTKTPLCHAGEDTRCLDLSGLSGIIEYEPSEYIFSARAGTPLSEINGILEEHGQYLPFDPPLSEAGATLGGTVAAGLSGPGRVRYGGLREFIIGVRFANGEGNVVKGGGKVVKNAAGFDLPKFLAGSLGRFAILLETTFKVFPKPEARVTLALSSDSLVEGLEKMLKVSLSKWEPDALELEADGKLFVRLAGDRAGLLSRADEIFRVLGQGIVLEESTANDYWRSISEFSWINQDSCFAKVPISPRMIPRLDGVMKSLPVERRYSMGGGVAWVGWQDECVAAKVNDALCALDLAGLVVRGVAQSPFIGQHPGYSIHSRVKNAFDPKGRFPQLL
jgi:glycolate oxidase FAD binding subunit